MSMLVMPGSEEGGDDGAGEREKGGVTKEDPPG